MEALIKEAPGLEALTIFQDLQRRYPGKFQDGQLRTLQRHMRVWRGLSGPDCEVFFPQVHQPGIQGQSDFTSHERARDHDWRAAVSAFALPLRPDLLELGIRPDLLQRELRVLKQRESRMLYGSWVVFLPGIIERTISAPRPSRARSAGSSTKPTWR